MSADANTSGCDWFSPDRFRPLRCVNCGQRRDTHIENTASEPRQDGYVEAFYEIVCTLGIEGPQPISPKQVHEEQVMPRLRALVSIEAASLAAEPVAWVIPGDDNESPSGFIDAMCRKEGEFTRPLYTAAPPAPDAEGLVAKLRRLVGNTAFNNGPWIDDARSLMGRAADTITALTERLAAAEAGQRAMLMQISELSTALGVAEGKLHVSELAGVVEGWQARAEAAEAEITALRKRCERMDKALEPFAKTMANLIPADPDARIGLAMPPRNGGTLTELSKLTFRHFEAARAALATKRSDDV